MIDDTFVKELDLRGQPSRLNVQWLGGNVIQAYATLVDLLESDAGMNKRHKL